MHPSGLQPWLLLDQLIERSQHSHAAFGSQGWNDRVLVRGRRKNNKMKPTNPNVHVCVNAKPGWELLCDTFVRHLDTPLVGSCARLLLDTLARHFCQTPLLDTLGWHSCALLLDTLARHFCQTGLLDTLACCWALLCDTLAGHSCVNSCLIVVGATFVRLSSMTILRRAPLQTRF